ncbi:MAG TPA: carbon-nitrogen hydrolase family protein [Stellaceae bacterium]|jgi:predicted amidohydrolase|nr:carbon-nitrogen hydrolase family protein [Stellaceae bacterium]
MSANFTAALVQFTAARDYEPNIRIVSEMIRRARDGGADLVLTPENTGLMEPIGKLRREKARDEANHPVLAALREVARETGAWLLLGSLAVDISREPGVSEGERRLANRSYLIDAAGGVVAHYDKIHMFDVDLAGGESYRESNAFRPGDRAVVAETPWGVLGMTVCYDLRFPQLYRALAQAGADFLAIPSAFTVPTGTAHWQVLLRARAIETGCFVFAPAQCGEHAEGRRTYGHSLIVDPWGKVLADGEETVGLVSARIDLGRIAEAHRMVPSLGHDRPFAGPERAGRRLAAE